MNAKLGVVVMCAGMSACMMQKDVQVKIIGVELVSVDTVNRGDYQEKVFTWQSRDSIRFYSWGKPGMDLPLGSQMTVMVKQ